MLASIFPPIYILLLFREWCDRVRPDVIMNKCYNGARHSSHPSPGEQFRKFPLSRGFSVCLSRAWLYVKWSDQSFTKLFSLSSSSNTRLGLGGGKLYFSSVRFNTSFTSRLSLCVFVEWRMGDLFEKTSYLTICLIQLWCLTIAEAPFESVQCVMS